MAHSGVSGLPLRALRIRVPAELSLDRIRSAARRHVSVGIFRFACYENVPGLRIDRHCKEGIPAFSSKVRPVDQTVACRVTTNDETLAKSSKTVVD